MYYSRSERLSQIAAYDRYVENAEQALQNSRVANRLGDLAGELLQMLNICFLPNVRSGRFVIPVHKKLEEKVAVLPITNIQATHAHDVMTFYRTERPAKTWVKDWSAASDRYSLDLSDKIDAHYNGLSSLGEEEYRLGFAPRVTALTWYDYRRSNNGEYQVLWPRILVRRKLANHEVLTTYGATLAHELVHAADILADGPIFDMAEYICASELRAYHVSAIIHEETGTMTDAGRYDLSIDVHRQLENPDTQPFRPTPRLQDYLVGMGCLAAQAA